MTSKNIIYLSANMERYAASHYQIDVMEELARQASVFFYGPGYPGYDIKNSIRDIIAKSHMKPDCIIMGHSWLGDQDGKEIDRHPLIALHTVNLPKIALLNKEYTNLKAKLEYIKRNKFDYAFSHHHDTERYSKITGIPFQFWPFAVNHHRLMGINSKEEREIDVGFAGILQNQNRNAAQADIRVKFLNKFFYSAFDIPIKKKKSYKKIDIFWIGVPRKKLWRRFSKLLQIKSFLPPKEYYEALHNSKIFLNSLSPMGLVGPRYYDIMASRCLLFCVKTPIYQRIFSKNNFVEFNADLSDFDKKLFYYLNNEEKRLRIVEDAYKDVLENHTWEKRVNDLLKVLL